jgi:uroporphyrin-3 C-methyltransferase
MSDQSPQDSQSAKKPEEDVSAPKGSPEATETRNADFFSRIGLTQLILAVLVVVFAWQWFEGRRLMDNVQQQLAIKIGEMQSGSSANRQLLAQSKEQITELYAKVALLESRYAEVQELSSAQELSKSELSASSEEGALAEVEQMLLNAAEQLQLSGNVRAALIFMQSADARLRRLGRPVLRDLSKVIGKDMDKLRALPVVDIAGLNRDISTLIAAVDDLPLAYQRRTAGGSDANAVTLPEETTVQRLLREVWQELRQLVEIENTGKDEIPLLHPEQQFFLRENLKLRLLSARIALLSRDETIFRQELKSTQLWTARYFDADSPSVSEVLNGMKNLGAARIRVELPDLGASLQAVRNYRLTSEKATR